MSASKARKIKGWKCYCVKQKRKSKDETNVEDIAKAIAESQPSPNDENINPDGTTEPDILEGGQIEKVIRYFSIVHFCFI